MKFQNRYNFSKAIGNYNEFLICPSFCKLFVNQRRKTADLPSSCGYALNKRALMRPLSLLLDLASFCSYQMQIRTNMDSLPQTIIKARTNGSNLITRRRSLLLRPFLFRVRKIFKNFRKIFGTALLKQYSPNFSYICDFINILAEEE